MDELTKEFLAESQEGLDRMERCLTELDIAPKNRGLVDEIFRAVHTLKGTTSFLGFERLQALAHAGESLLSAVRAGRIPVTTDLISDLLALHDGLRFILRLIETTGGEGQRSTDGDSDLIARILARTTADSAVGISSAGVPSLSALTSAALAESPSPAASQIERLLHDATPQAQTADHGERRISSESPDTTVRVDTDVLNRLMNLVGELVLTRNGILQGAGSGHMSPELVRRLDSVTSELRSVVMRARMQPVNQLFGKFPRIVRDLAQACDRKVRLEFEAQGAELDKTLLEAVRAPLTHAVRNAVDHGIEPPQERILKGKNPEGLIRLRAYSQSGGVVIEISDDGAGIAVDRVLNRAVERGLITAERSARMSSEEALRLLFEPGFSTAATVTCISGRGVGLDVVRTHVEKVGGRVEIESSPGVGTVLRFRMPLTLAIVPALIVRSSGQSFAIPQSRLVQLVYLAPNEIPQAMEKIGTAEFVRLRNRLLPMVRLGQALGLAPSRPFAGCGLYLAVAEADARQYALVVDELLPPEEIVVKPLSPLLRQSGVFVGAGMLGSGEVVMILDIGGIGRRSGVRPHSGQGTGAPLAQPAAPPGAGPAESPSAERFLVYQVPGSHPGECERIAVPLSAVERIETVRRHTIQFSAGQALLLYGPELLPLEDEGGLLRSAPDTEVTVVICRSPRRCGIVVGRVVSTCQVETSQIDAAEAGHSASLAPASLALIDNVATQIRAVPRMADRSFEKAL